MSCRCKSLIDRLCAEVGPRPSGSPAELHAAELLAAELAGMGIAPELERFEVTRRAMQVMLLSLSAGYFVALALYLFGLPGWTLGALGLTVGNYLAHSLWGYHLFSLLLPSWRGATVLGKIAARDSRRQLVVFSGHIDSAYRMPIFSRRTLPLLAASLLGLIAGVLLLAALSVVALLHRPAEISGGGPWSVIGPGLCMLVAAGVLVLLAGTLRPDAVAGANDNLSGVSVAWEIARRLAAQPLATTEVWVVAFGAEEAVLAGSRAFARRHAVELGDAWIVNLESLAQDGELRVVTTELQSLLAQSPELNDRLVRAARDLGVNIRPHFLAFGLTDAASFRRRGLEATTLLRLDEDGLIPHYHTALDIPANVHERFLDEAVRISLRFLEMTDALDRHGRPRLQQPLPRR